MLNYFEASWNDEQFMKKKEKNDSLRKIVIGRKIKDRIKKILEIKHNKYFYTTINVENHIN